jgi:hypothetical protein
MATTNERLADLLVKAKQAQENQFWGLCEDELKDALVLATQLLNEQNTK